MPPEPPSTKPSEPTLPKNTQQQTADHHARQETSETTPKTMSLMDLIGGRKMPLGEDEDVVRLPD